MPSSPVSKIRVKGVYYDLVRPIENIDSSTLITMGDSSTLMKTFTDSNNDNVYVASHSDIIKITGENKTLSNNLKDLNTSIKLLPFETSPLCIMTDTWVKNTNNQPHWTIPVIGGETVEFHRTGNDRTVYYAFLTEYSTPVIGDTPQFLTGYEGRQHTINPFTVPDGCKYLIFNYVNDLEYLKINGIDVLKGIWPIALKRISGDNIINRSITTEKLNQTFVENIENLDNSIEILERDALKESDLTLIRVSKNLADPANIIMNTLVNSSGVLQGSSGWDMIKIDVTPGDVISFGGFYLGRGGFAAFYDANDTLVGTRLAYNDPNGSYHAGTLNKTVPPTATKFYIDIKSPNSPSNPYDNLMVNIGSELLPYEDYNQYKVSEINGYDILGADSTLETKVSELEDDVEELKEQGATIPEIIADLPVSDGSGISSGYAYIDSTTYTVKVKQ